MTLAREHVGASVLCLLAALLAGCEPSGTAKPAKPTSPITPAGTVNDQLNPCAERLHDLCQQLLLYYSAHKKLPASLAELGGDGSAKGWICPISGKPYVYNPDGLVMINLKGSLIVYDSEPCGTSVSKISGAKNSPPQKNIRTRWGIMIMQPKPGKPLVISVVNQPDVAFVQNNQPE